MNVAFRVDASLQIGSGHVMRCLTLADLLKQRGEECTFLCREHPGHLIELIRGKGYTVHGLACEQKRALVDESPAHAAWLGARQKQDADACRATLKARQFDWLIVDHYALDIHWEEALRPYYSRLMVIDDLADRRHVCDLLLDQNLGRKPSDYERLIPESCMVLAGPQYALLRPEFAALREYSLMRREKPNLRNILITMGGVDQPNATCRVLEALNQCTLPSDCKIGVVMGDKAPWLEQVKASAAHLRWPAEVLVNISDMAQRMADCDLVIGAAGSTAWERCCLGVPTLMVVLADNQRFGAEALQGALAAKLLGNVSDIGQLPIIFTSIVTDAELQSMGRMAARITDGLGATRVVDSLAGLPR